MSKLTFSAITTYNRCPYAYYLRYEEGRVPKDADLNLDGDINAFKFGSLVHEGLAHHWLGHEEYATFFEPATVRERCAVAMIERYHETYPTDRECYDTEAVEAQFETEHFRGQVDGIIIDHITGERILLEHKTATIINDDAMDAYKAKLAMDLQIRLYCHAVGVRRVLYDVLVKPNIRRKKAETDDEYVARYKEGCEFMRFEIELTDADIASAIDDARQVYTDVNSGRFCKCRNNCSWGVKCDYFDLCAGRKTIDDYDLKTPNAELVGESVKGGGGNEDT